MHKPPRRTPCTRVGIRGAARAGVCETRECTSTTCYFTRREYVRDAAQPCATARQRAVRRARRSLHSHQKVSVSARMTGERRNAPESRAWAVDVRARSTVPLTAASRSRSTSMRPLKHAVRSEPTSIPGPPLRRERKVKSKKTRRKRNAPCTTPKSGGTGLATCVKPTLRLSREEKVQVVVQAHGGMDEQVGRRGRAAGGGRGALPRCKEKQAKEGCTARGAGRG
ncbi:hypothetical protein DFH09DRAFT_1095436 [Mycena vulgaris]|nr:hypothetical protein DFH09DRAFT_1095436 [Mycena vulgaris]